MLTALKGNILHVPVFGQYDVIEHGYIVLEDGVIRGLFEKLPERCAKVPVTDYGDKLIVQSFCDMHLHAPQYVMLGMGMDLPLLEWLNAYTFKTESQFADADYAREVYRALAKDLIRHGTTRFSMFSSLHRASTIVLMEELEQAGLLGLVGKVSMDRNSPDYLSESTEESKNETLRWLEECRRFSRIKPILTPRFTPSCTDELLSWLGNLANERDLPVQTHLSESLREIRWVKELHPDCDQYWETYDKYGLLKNGTLLAHCVHSDEREQLAIRDRGAVVVHCPDSNINICSGFAPIREMLDRGLSVVLGSDIAGGALLPMPQVITSAIRTSNAKRMESGDTIAALTVAEAYYLGATAGAKYFGFGDGFAAGDEFHAIVLDDSGLPKPKRPLSVAERFERLLYLGDDRSIVATFAGRQLFA